MKKEYFKNILICRTDHIGDVVLTLPLAGILKANYPDCNIAFLISNYTEGIVKKSVFVDEIILYEDLQKLEWKDQKECLKKFDVCLHVFPKIDIVRLIYKVNIPIRIGSSRRWFNWIYCNKLINIKRKRSPLHEAQLNTKILKPLISRTEYSLSELSEFQGLKASNNIPDHIKVLLKPDHFKLILHPLSHGNSRNWALENFVNLASELTRQDLQIIITGSPREKLSLDPMFAPLNDKILNLSGRLNLDEFVDLIQYCDGMVVNATGPMHVAAAFGKRVIGLFIPYYTMHPSRWGPVGKHAEYIMMEESCNGCKNDESCLCIKKIVVNEVIRRLEQWEEFPK